MKIEINYKRSQVLQALRYHFISRREIKFMMILVNVFALLSAGLFYFKLITPLPFLMSSFLWLSMMGAFWLWLPWLIYRRSKTFKDHFYVILDENHLVIESASSQKIWAWREFQTVMETPGFFHLYFDTRSFFLIPKEAFENAEDIQKARRIMHEKIKNK